MLRPPLRNAHPADRSPHWSGIILAIALVVAAWWATASDIGDLPEPIPPIYATTDGR